MSGRVGHGGIDDFNTYLFISGCLQFAGTGLGLGQRHGHGFLQRSHCLLVSQSSKPSCFTNLHAYNPTARPTINTPTK